MSASAPGEITTISAIDPPESVRVVSKTPLTMEAEALEPGTV